MSCCSVPKLCRAVCHPMNCISPDSSVLYYLPEFAQPHIPCLHVIKFLFDFLLFMSIQFSDQSEEPRRLKENSFLPDQIMYLSKFGGGVGRKCHKELDVQDFPNYYRGIHFSLRKSSVTFQNSFKNNPKISSS